MRIDIDTVLFSGVSNGATIATLDLSGVEYAAVGVSVTTLTGGPTTLRSELIPSADAAGTILFAGGDIFGTVDVTGAPVAAPQRLMVARIGLAGAAKTTILAEGFLLPPPLKYGVVTIGLAGGAAPTASGTVYIFKFTR